MELTLRGYQDELISDLRTALSKYQAVLAQSPTGTGKSRVIEFIVRSVLGNGLSCFCLVPNIELLENLTQYFDDLSPGIIHRDTTTNWDSNIWIGNSDSVHPRLDKFPRIPEYLIVDECKHSRAPTWEAIINRFKDAGSKIIGFDATPCRGDGQGFAGLFEYLVTGKSVSWHIEHGYLSQFEYHSEPQEFNFESLVTDFSDHLGKQSKILDHPEVIQNRIRRWSEISYGEQTLYYGTTIEHVENVRAAFNEFGLEEFKKPIARCISSKMRDENGYPVSGKKAAGLRKQYFNEFKNGDIHILTNVGIFTEGVDVPDCTTVQIDKFMNSYSDVAQIWGRALRPGENKIAKIIDHTGLYIKHLKPDAKVKWTLDEGLIKPPRKASEDDSIDCQCGAVLAPSRRRFYALNPGVNKIECPECGTVKELRRRVRKGGEVPMVSNGELQLIKVTNNIIQIHKSLKTFYTKTTKSGKSYKKAWMLYQIEDMDDLTYQEVNYALGTIYPEIVINSFCTKRGIPIESSPT